MTSSGSLFETVVFVAVWCVVAARVLVERDGAAERRMTSALLFAGLAVTARTPLVTEVVDGTLGAGATRWVSNVFVLLTVASLVALLSAWVHGAGRFPRVHGIALGVALLLGVVHVLLSARAAAEGVRGVGGSGFATAATAVYAMPLLVTALLVFRSAVTHFREPAQAPRVRAGTGRPPDLRGPQRRTYLMVAAFAAFEVVDMSMVLTTSVSQTLAGSGEPAVAYDTDGWVRLGVVLAATVIASVPLVRRVDRTRSYRRTRRRIQPMWRTLTAAVPEVVLDVRSRDARELCERGRLHRTCVETRDAALLVAPFVPSAWRRRCDERSSPWHVAVGLHLAVRARRSEAPTHGWNVGSASADLRDEAHELAAIGDVWDEAGRFAETWSGGLGSADLTGQCS